VHGSGNEGEEVRMDVPSLAQKLRVLRARRAFTLRQVEALTGVDKHTISNAERGLSVPYDATLRRLADVYGVDVSELMEAKLGVPLGRAA
jgi:transcriptional regulator with XRE-family HTH domain